jgi:hypothetical protein
MRTPQSVGALIVGCLLAWPVAVAGENGSAQQRDRTRQDVERLERNQKRFRGMDRDNDGVITRAEWRGNDRSFRNHDRNGDGVLAGDEVWVNVATPGAPTTDRPGAQRWSLDEAFDGKDRNNDGILSRAEWSSDAATFARVDVNKDGVITRPEFLGEGWDEAAATAGTSGDPAGRRDSPAFQSGYDRGLSDGRQAGREDRQIDRWDLDGQRELEQADAGYQPSLGPRADYQAGYRAGFRAGYQQGFGPKEPGRP